MYICILLNFKIFIFIKYNLPNHITRVTRLTWYDFDFFIFVLIIIIIIVQLFRLASTRR